MHIESKLNHLVVTVCHWQVSKNALAKLRERARCPALFIEIQWNKRAKTPAALRTSTVRFLFKRTPHHPHYHPYFHIKLRHSLLVNFRN